MSSDAISQVADLKYDVRVITKGLLDVLTPTTERFAAVETTVRYILDTLENYQAETTLAVLGDRGSGKSTLINSLMGMACIPRGNTRALPVAPFVSETPMLRLATGKAVACGEEGCFQHLQSEEEIWIEALASRRLHGPLPVIKGPHCYHAKWVVMDTAEGSACVLPKLSSVATRVSTPTYFSGALMWYCVDATKLMTPQEGHVLDLLLGSADPQDVSERGLRRLLSRTTFVLTHADYVSEFEDDVQSVLKKDTDGKTPLRTIADMKAHFLQLVRRRFPGIDVDPARVVAFSGRNALLTKRILMFEPEVQELYDYCEVVYGASFMQTIDTIEIDQLRRIVLRFAQETMLEKSGAKALTEGVRLFDFNAGRHQLCDLAMLALDSTEQLDRALAAAKPAVLREVTEYRSELECLISTTAWVLESTDAISSSSKTMLDEVSDVATLCLKEFFQERLHELRYVMEGRPLVWFSERQACTIMDIKSGLEKLTQFTEQYLLQRGFLEKKQTDGRASAGGYQFLDEHAAEILRAMEAQKKELLIDLSTKVAHHVKDEFSRYLPKMVERIREKQSQMVDMYMKKIQPPVTETENRIREQLEVAELARLLNSVDIIEDNDRRLKNFLRELPDHVAVAAVEISNQWYVPLDDEVLTNPPIPSKREQYEKQLKSATARQGDCDDESKFRMNTEILYVLEAWRLSFAMIQLHQLCTYNIHAFTNTVTDVNERVLDFINRLVSSLEEGAIAQKDDVTESERVVGEIDRTRVALVDVKDQLERLVERITSGMVFDVNAAEMAANQVDA